MTYLPLFSSFSLPLSDRKNHYEIPHHVRFDFPAHRRCGAGEVSLPEFTEHPRSHLGHAGMLISMLIRITGALLTYFIVLQVGVCQSSPTYFIHDRAGHQLVMRKYPPGLSDNTTHRLERQYRVLRALENSTIPAPKPYCLCEDPSVLGTSFSIVEFLDGRTFHDPSLPGVSPRERHDMWVVNFSTICKSSI